MWIKMEKKSSEIHIKVEEDSESNYSIQESEEVSNDFTQSGSSIQGSEEVKDDISQSDSSVEGSEKVRVYLDQTEKYNKIKDENANIKTLLGKRPAEFSGLPRAFDLDNEGVKKRCDNLKSGASALPVISDVWTEKNPTALSGIFSHQRTSKPCFDKNKVEEEWQQTFKVSNELPDPEVLFGGSCKKSGDGLFKKPTKPAPIPLTKVSWKPPVLTGENSLDEKLLSGLGAVGQSTAARDFNPAESGTQHQKCFLKCDSFKTCGGSLVCLDQSANSNDVPRVVCPPTRSILPPQQEKLTAVLPPSARPHPVEKKVKQKLDKPEKSHINRAIKHSAEQQKDKPGVPRNVQMKNIPSEPRKLDPRPRNRPPQPRPIVQRKPRQVKREKGTVPMIHLPTPEIGHGTNPAKQFDFTLGCHYTGGSMFCAKKIDMPTDQVVVPTDFVKGLMNSGGKRFVDPAVDLVTPGDIKRFLNVPEKPASFGSYGEQIASSSPVATPQMSHVSSFMSTNPSHSAIRTLLNTKSGGLVPRFLTAPKISWPAASQGSASAPPSPRRERHLESKTTPLIEKGSEKSSKPSSPSLAEKIEMFKAEMSQKASDGREVPVLIGPSEMSKKPTEILSRRRHSVGTDFTVKAEADQQRTAWLNSDSLLPPNMPLSLNISERKDAAATSGTYSDTVDINSSPRSSASSASSSWPIRTLHVDCGSLPPPNVTPGLESPGRRSLKSPQSAASPRRNTEQPVIFADVRRPISANISDILPMPRQLESPVKRNTFMSPPQTMDPSYPSPPLPIRFPWMYGAYETSQNMRMDFQFVNSMKPNNNQPTLSYRVPFVCLGSPTRPVTLQEVPKPTVSDQSPVKQAVEKFSLSDNTPSVCKDESCSTSSSFTESLNFHQKVTSSGLNHPVSPSQTKAAAVSPVAGSKPHVCISPKKRKYVPVPDEKQSDGDDVKRFLPHLGRLGSFVHSLEGLPMAHSSPLWRSEPNEHAKQGPSQELPPSAMGSPYERNFEPSDPRFRVGLQLPGILPLAPVQHIGLTYLTNSGLNVPQSESIICAADSTEEKNNEPLNLVVPKRKIDPTELPKRHVEHAMDLSKTARESAMDLRTCSVQKQSVAEVVPVGQRHLHPGEPESPHCETGTSDYSGEVPVVGESGLTEGSRDQSSVAKDTGIDRVNHFLQSMHSIRFKDSKGEQSGGSENGAGEESTVTEQGDTQMAGNDANGTGVVENGAGTSQGVCLNHNGTETKASDPSSGFVGSGKDVLRHGASGIMESDLEVTKGCGHSSTGSVSTIASDCHFCGVPNKTSSQEENGACVEMKSQISDQEYCQNDSQGVTMGEFGGESQSKFDDHSGLSDTNLGQTLSNNSNRPSKVNNETCEIQKSKDSEHAGVTNVILHSTGSQELMHNRHSPDLNNEGQKSQISQGVKFVSDTTVLDSGSPSAGSGGDEINSGYNNSKRCTLLPEDLDEGEYDVKLLAAFALDLSKPEQFTELKLGSDLREDSKMQTTTNLVPVLNSVAHSREASEIDLKRGVKLNESEMEVEPPAERDPKLSEGFPRGPIEGTGKPEVAELVKSLRTRHMPSVDLIKRKNSDTVTGKQFGNNNSGSFTELDADKGKTLVNIRTQALTDNAVTTVTNAVTTVTNAVTTVTNAVTTVTNAVTALTNAVTVSNTGDVAGPSKERLESGGNTQTAMNMETRSSVGVVNGTNTSAVGRVKAEPLADVGECDAGYIDDKTERVEGTILGRHSRTTSHLNGEERPQKIRKLAPYLMHHAGSDEGGKSGNFDNEVLDFSKKGVRTVDDGGYTALKISQEAQGNVKKSGCLPSQGHVVCHEEQAMDLSPVKVPLRGAKTEVVRAESVTSCSDEGELVIDESASSADSDSNRGKTVVSNLDLLATVSSVFADSQKQPVSQPEPTVSGGYENKEVIVPDNKSGNMKQYSDSDEDVIVDVENSEEDSRNLEIGEDYNGKREVYRTRDSGKFDHPKSRRYRAVSANGGRQLLPEWIEQQVERRDIPGLEWVDRSSKIVRIPWRHSRSTLWKKNDCMLFERWAIHTCKHAPGDPPNPKRWKTNFRCALNLYAKRLHHGKDYCCYQLFDTAIIGSNSANAKQGKVTPPIERPSHEKSSTKEVSESLPKIPTVIFELEERELDDDGRPFKKMTRLKDPKNLPPEVCLSNWGMEGGSEVKQGDQGKGAKQSPSQCREARPGKNQ